MDILGGKDKESTQIIYEISIMGKNIERKIDVITDTINEMKKIKNNILTLSEKQDDFMKNKELIKDYLYEIGGFYYCFFLKIFNDRLKYDKKVDSNIKSSYLTGISAIPGCHDYNVILARCFNYKVFKEFYLGFLENIDIFLESNARLYPRYFKEISKCKDSYYITEHVLLTKEDLGYQITKNLNKNNIEDRKKIIEYENNWKFSNCKLPKYYSITGKLGSKEYYWNLCFNNTQDKEACERVYNIFMKTEYPIYKELTENKEHYLHLPNIKISTL